MKKMLFAATLLMSFNAHAQVYDLVRTITNTPGSIEDSTTSFFTQTGTMEINGNKLTRTFQTCITSKPCLNKTYNDEIIGASDKSALIAGDSGDFVPITIFSLHPTIIIFYSSGDFFSIDEYKPR